MRGGAGVVVVVLLLPEPPLLPIVWTMKMVTLYATYFPTLAYVEMSVSEPI
jgi:hypothetical protein